MFGGALGSTPSDLLRSRASTAALHGGELFRQTCPVGELRIGPSRNLLGRSASCGALAMTELEGKDRRSLSAVAARADRVSSATRPKLFREGGLCRHPPSAVLGTE